jgi:hypothetical protein
VASANTVGVAERLPHTKRVSTTEERQAKGAARNTPPPPVSQQETLTDLLKQAHRTAVPLRTTFVQQGRGKATQPGPLASFIAAHDERGLDAYLFVHALASGPPWDCEYPSGMWIRALGLSDTATMRSARGIVSKTMRRLEDRKLIQRKRSGRLSAVTLLREDGSGEGYGRPVADGDNWFNLSHTYWLEEHYRALSLPAKAMLLIALSLPLDFYLPYEKAKPWYGISPDSAGRGLRELEKASLLLSVPEWKKNHRSDTGWIEQRHYMLLGPYAKPTRRRRAGKDAGGPVSAVETAGARTTVPVGTA